MRSSVLFCFLFFFNLLSYCSQTIKNSSSILLFTNNEKHRLHWGDARSYNIEDLLRSYTIEDLLYMEDDIRQKILSYCLQPLKNTGITGQQQRSYSTMSHHHTYHVTSSHTKNTGITGQQRHAGMPLQARIHGQVHAPTTLQVSKLKTLVVKTLVVKTPKNSPSLQIKDTSSKDTSSKDTQKLSKSPN